MASKAIKKRKIRQQFERNQARQGLINMPDGSWRKADSSINSMHRDYLGGYRVR